MDRLGTCIPTLIQKININWRSSWPIGLLYLRIHILSFDFCRFVLYVKKLSSIQKCDFWNDLTVSLHYIKHRFLTGNTPIEKLGLPILSISK